MRTPFSITNIYKSLGDGNFEELDTDIIQVYQGTVIWIDFNNDRRLDFFVRERVAPWNNLLTVLYKNIGEDKFAPVESPFPPLSQSDVAWADIDDVT